MMWYSDGPKVRTEDRAGEQTRDVLTKTLGYDAARIAGLEKSGALG